jgi:long-chain acyl-CoA synthetase
MKIAEAMEKAFRENEHAPMLEYKGVTYTRREVAAIGSKLISILNDAGVPAVAHIGLVSRNRALHCAVLAGLLRKGRSIATIHAFQTSEKLAADIRSLRLMAVVADVQDWAPAVVEAARDAGIIGIALDHDSCELRVIRGLEGLGEGAHRQPPDEAGVEILSSGTTGPPKRVLLPYRILEHSLASIMAGRSTGVPAPDVLVWPMGAIGGVAATLAATVLHRYVVLIDKFNVPEWAEAVARLRPRYLSGPATVARMVLDAGVPPETLACVEFFYGGGGPMSPELQTEFEERYNLRVIWAYGATEFCGTVVTWTPELYEQFDATKRGAMGRAMPGISLRVVDVETGVPLPAGQLGYLQAIVPVIGEDWLGTTDLCMIDEDGFVFHQGRGDGAIVRGGFKILPEQVADALRRHPEVRDAVVFGIEDRRLGSVPVAVVELQTGSAGATEADLISFARARLATIHIPTRIIIAESLPRTGTLKVDLNAARAMFTALAA